MVCELLSLHIVFCPPAPHQPFLLFRISSFHPFPTTADNNNNNQFFLSLFPHFCLIRFHHFVVMQTAVSAYVSQFLSEFNYVFYQCCGKKNKPFLLFADVVAWFWSSSKQLFTVWIIIYYFNKILCSKAKMKGIIKLKFGICHSFYPTFTIQNRFKFVKHHPNPKPIFTDRHISLSPNISIRMPNVTDRADSWRD